MEIEKLNFHSLRTNNKTFNNKAIEIAQFLYSLTFIGHSQNIMKVYKKFKMMSLKIKGGKRQEKRHILNPFASFRIHLFACLRNILMGVLSI